MEKQNQKLESRGLCSINAGQVEINFYTDPLCCWSWAWRSHLQHLRTMLGEQATWNLKMGGLIPDWKHYNDVENAVSRPSQMGPVWMHAGQIAGRPICHQLWHTDPPATSYLSCIAVKCAELQSADLAFRLLRYLQDVCMEQGRNIAKKEVLLDVIRLFSADNPLFNKKAFESDFTFGSGKILFSQDLDEVRKYNINRFPSLIIRYNKKNILIGGYRSAVTIFDAVRSIFPELIENPSM